MALRRHIELGHADHRATQVCQVSRLVAHLLREIIATSGSYYGVTGQYGPVSVPSATLQPEAMGTETPILNFGACVTHRATQVCQVSSLWHTYSER
ncbi:hypothetical protein DPMN_003859 [Dreissena polymorpha]|uniref:Uncharacterized protein n=1 Tax=Dreissena polymorpha TaxID=45954 RepID=A0A9D4MMI8_DREPO|nr:hypothetical protein DPMN_003859 [Dreissena polymorpha]